MVTRMPLAWPELLLLFQRFLLPSALGCSACHASFKSRVTLTELQRAEAFQPSRRVMRCFLSLFFFSNREYVKRSQEFEGRLCFFSSQSRHLHRRGEFSLPSFSCLPPPSPEALFSASRGPQASCLPPVAAAPHCFPSHSFLLMYREFSLTLPSLHIERAPQEASSCLKAATTTTPSGGRGWREHGRSGMRSVGAWREREEEGSLPCHACLESATVRMSLTPPFFIDIELSEFF